MEKLSVNLANCFGIKALQYDFDFGKNKNSRKAFAIYAPNGVMKTSFAKTFERLSEGKQPEDERFNQPTICEVEVDGQSLLKETIYVLRSEKDINSAEINVTNVLVNPQYKARYDNLVVDIEKKKTKLIKALHELSGWAQSEIEGVILRDCGERSLLDCVQRLPYLSFEIDVSKFKYSIIFDPKAMAIWLDRKFTDNATEFTSRYQELFTPSNTIYRKGIFNPTKADAVLKALKNQSYFTAGHKVHLRDDELPLDQAEFERRLNEANAIIDDDASLKQLRTNMAKNAEVKEFSDLLENLSSSELKILLEWLKPENEKKLRIAFWGYYIRNTPEANVYVDAYAKNQAELERIEKEATQLNQSWEILLKHFNNRFIGMPFTLSISNPGDVVLKEQPAKLLFTFKDDKGSSKECGTNDAEMKTLSVGEERALKLLYFLFEVEKRKKIKQKTLFIIDDIADSFDYKNKTAILLYLQDLCEEPQFYQIILTHNFDFFRAVSQSFVHRDRCLMSNRVGQEIKLEKAEGINNIFVNIWKTKVFENGSMNAVILYVTVPFVRNLIEYTRGDQDQDYQKLTSLLHWKDETNNFTIADYIKIYNAIFNPKKTYPISDNKPMYQLLFEQADRISGNNMIRGLDLEGKVLLSIAVRMKAERLMVTKLRSINPNYSLPTKNQFGELLKDLKAQNPNLPMLQALDEVSITVSSNIHLNSFMYEPILDLSIDHLIDLYNRIKQLQS